MKADEALVEFLQWLAHERRASPLTVEAYQRDIGGLLGFLTRHLGAEPDLAALACLRAADLRGWLAERARDGVGAATRARQLSAVRSFFRWLTRRHDVSNPQVKLLATPRTKRPLPKALSAAEATAVTTDIGEIGDRGVVQARDIALLSLLYGSGLRIAEALALNVADAPVPGGDAVLRSDRKGIQAAHRAGAARGTRGDRRLAEAASGSPTRLALVRGGCAAAASMPA